MFLKVAVKSVGNLHRAVEPALFWIEGEPRTVCELIDLCVRSSVEAYRRRADEAGVYAPLSDEQYAAMREVGKFAFCLPVESREVDMEDAVRVAREAFADGLVRLFVGTRELCTLDEPLALTEDDTLTFIRLTFLSGRMW